MKYGFEIKRIVRWWIHLDEDEKELIETFRQESHLNMNHQYPGGDELY